jgi:hypothetical protein
MPARIGNYVPAMFFIAICLFSNAFLVPSNVTAVATEVPSSRVVTSNVVMDSMNLADKASHIVVGKVENIESRLDKATSAIYTYVQFHVEECLKGKINGDNILIKYKGGEIGNLGLWVSDQPHFLLNEEVKVFLKPEKTGEFTVVDGNKGKISLVSPASSGFSYSGIHWDRNDLPVPYYINENCTPEEIQAVQASFQTWEDDPGSYMNYTYMGTTTRSNASLDGYNVISWQPIDGPSRTLARTTYRYNPSTNLTIEFDIVFDEDETWSTMGEPGKYDIQNVGTHEVGHTLVLEDLYDPADSEQTMYGYCSLGETKKRTPEAGDLAGIRYIYPLPQSPKLLYTITASYSGLQIEVDGTVYTAPQPFEWAPNSTHTLFVPSIQNGSLGTRYAFTSWSDGGAQQHQITVGTSSITIIAFYTLQHFAIIETHGLRSAYPATVNFIQLGMPRTFSTSDSWNNWCDSGSTLAINSYVIGEEGQRWFTSNINSWAVNAALTATVNYILQYQVSMAFKTYDQAVTIKPTQIQILGGSPSNTLLTLGSYSALWLGNVTWTLKQVLWQGNNVIALNNPSVTLSPKYEWTITCRVYPISFETAFKNFKGVALNENPSFFTLKFPNGTESRQLNPSNVYYVQNGTTRWASITWQDVDVVPPDAYFNATEGNPTVNCLIYDFAVKVSDFLGFPVAGAYVSAKLSNGRTVNTQTGPDGVAIIRMAPQGGFTAFVSYFTETTKISGNVAEAALAPVDVKTTFGFSILILISLSCVLAGGLVVFLLLRMVKNKRMRIGIS